MIRYNINPDNEIYAHIEQKDHPYIQHTLTDAFIGHKEAGRTACPGKNLFALLPHIQNDIRNSLAQQKKLSKRLKARRIHYINTPYTIDPTQSTTLNIPLPQQNHVLRCSSGTKNIKLSCKKEKTNTLKVSLEPRNLTTIPEYITINVTTKITSPNLRLVIQTKPYTQLPQPNTLTQPILKPISTLQPQKNEYIKTHNPSFAQSTSNKFKQTITLQDLPHLSTEPVHVLLYEASKNL